MSQPNLFGPDPIDLFDPSPYFALSYYAHILIGIVALLAALTAFAVIKGGKWHRRAGWTFIAAVAVVSASSFEMLANTFIPPLFMAVFTAIYAVGGAWLALRKRTRTVRLAEAGLTLFEIAGLAMFLLIAIPAARAGLVPMSAPVVIAIIPIILLAGDVNWFARRDQQVKMRVARHFNRMVWAFVVVLRAPLVELAAAGIPISVPFTIFAPLALGIALSLYFRSRYGVPRKPLARA